MTAIFKHKPAEAAKCPVCLEEEGGDWYAHGGGGEAHPIHAECLKSWFKEGKTSCPVCRAELDPTPLAERVEKAVHSKVKFNEALASLLFLHLFARSLQSRMFRQMESSLFFQPTFFMPRVRREVIFYV